MDRRIHAMGARVAIDSGWTDRPLRGTVMGHTVLARTAERPYETSLYYIIQLDSGFYSEDRNVFVTLLTVHSSNVEV